MNERVTIDALTSDHHLPREQEPLVFKSLKSVRGTLFMPIEYGIFPPRTFSIRRNHH
jgi:hypothetical protein